MMRMVSRNSQRNTMAVRQLPSGGGDEACPVKVPLQNFSQDEMSAEILLKAGNIGGLAPPCN